MSISLQPIYLDVDEEIPDLIARLRSNPAPEVPVVVPSHSRLGQSRFNFQILRDYCRSLGKRVGVVSGDAGVRRLAEETGFPAYADLDEFKWAAERAPIAAPANAVPIGAAAAVAATAMERPAPPVRPQPVRPAAAPVEPPVRAASAVAAVGGPSRFLLYLGAGLILSVALLSTAVLVPSADVTLTAHATPLATEAQIVAAPNSAPVRVRQVTGSKSGSRQFPATGQKVTPATPATGSVTWKNDGSCGVSISIPAKITLSTSDGKQFTQTADAGPIPPGGTATAPVTAASAGAPGNVAANSITQFNGQKGVPCLSVTNPQATSGGTDEKREPQITQNDLDTARQLLKADLQPVLTEQLSGQAGSGEKLFSTLDLKDDFSADHKVGDLAGGFTANDNMTAAGAVYNTDDVTRAFSAELTRTVPAGYTLTDNPVDAQYSVQGSSDGHLQFSGKVKGWMAPKVDYNEIRSHLIGASTSSAKAYLRSHKGVASAEIKERPVSLPVLPVLASRINLRYVVDAVPAASS